MNKALTLFRWLYLAIMAVALMAAGGSHAANVPAPAPAVAPADFEKLQDQVRSLEKDNAVLNAKIDAQNNRIADLSLAATQQGNHIAVASNQTAVIGNFFGLLGVFIPVLLIVAGVITYR
ncbi:MAG: hypothetical protein KA207_17490, partial [Burkholderiaceae bacterium]|nr:hypothetical protein [Burkholderiaceae bacterium]